MFATLQVVPIFDTTAEVYSTSGARLLDGVGIKGTLH
jgi:hypothetical protein